MLMRVVGSTSRADRATAHAPENHRDHRIAHDLAVARVMRALELELMEWIHEHIDRYIKDE